MKRIVIAALMCLSMVATASAADVKLGFVDLQKALSMSAAGQAAKAKMDGEIQTIEDEVKKRESDLRALQESLQKQAALLSAEAKAEKERDFQQQVKDFQRFTKDKQEEMRGKEMTYTQQILRDLGAQVVALSKEQGITMMFEKSQLVYAIDTIDYTDALIKAYDAVYKDSHK
jgi:outer membrane protein